MTNNPNPQQNKPASSSQAQGDRTETNQANRQDAGRTQGSGSTQFGGIRGAVEQGYGSEKSSRSGSQEIERCLNAIEENCQKLRSALSASGSSSSISRSESTDSSRSSSANQAGGNQAGRSNNPK